jgi:hypothetical protein
MDRVTWVQRNFQFIDSKNMAAIAQGDPLAAVAGD